MVFPSINLLFWSVLTPHVSVIIESMLNQAWSPGYLSIFLSGSILLSCQFLGPDNMPVIQIDNKYNFALSTYYAY